MRKVENFIRVVLVWLALLLAGGMAYAEGTKELQPVAAEPYYLLINRGGGLGVPFATYQDPSISYQTGTSSIDYRLNVKICNSGEKIKLGFRGNEGNTFYQIKNQAGTIVFGPALVPFLYSINDVSNKGPGSTCRIQTTSTHGFAVGDWVTISNVGGVPCNGVYQVQTVPATNRFTISKVFSGSYTANSGNVEYRNNNIQAYTEAVAGPASLPAAGGYKDTTFTTSAGTGGAGDYFIEFNRGSSSTYANNQITICWYDISVTNSAGNTLKPGRLWSKTWYLVDGGSNAFQGAFFIYADDGIVTKLNNTSISPHAFSISCNATGVSNTGNPAVDQKSVAGPSVYPQYKLFLNDPDNACYLTGSFGFINGAVTVTGCGSTRCINVNVSQKGNIIVTLDMNNNGVYNPGTTDRQISFTATASGPQCIPWDGLNGSGGAIAPGTNIPLIVDFLNGITHLPLYDCEDNSKGYYVTLVRPSLGTAPKIFWDDANIAGIGSAPDGTVNLGGCTPASSTNGCHKWGGRGDNTCPPCSETVNSWWYANIVTSSTSVPFNSTVVDANTTLPGTGAANNGFKSCKTSTTVNLNGSVTSSPAGATATWSSLGTGTFANASNAVTTYTPSTADTSAGSVVLILTAGATASCPIQKDSLKLTFVTGAKANAGPDVHVCKNNTTTVIAGASRTPAASAILWTGGAGTFVANNTVLALTYNPTVAEANAAFLDLTMKVTPTDVTCPAVTDQVRIFFDDVPTVNAGLDLTICNGVSIQVDLTNIGAVVSPDATSSTWSSVSGCVPCLLPGPIYVPTVAEILSGQWKLVLSASKPGCLPVRDTVTITVGPAQTVNAGPDQTKCKNNAVATLAGSTTNLGTGTLAWTSSSGCSTCFSSTTTATPTYTPSAGDLSTGSVTLTLTATKAGCAVKVDDMKITYTASPTLNVGADQNVCSSSPVINFNAVTTVATGVNWDIAYGSGTFAANRNVSSGSYTLSAGEVTAGIALLVAQTTGIGTCAVVKDSLLIFVRPSPTIDAGNPINVCANQPTVALVGTAPGAPGGTTYAWTSLSPVGQQGTFSASTSLTGNYTLSAQEITNGTATLRLSATAPFCAVVTDNVVITVQAAPTVNAGADQNGLCFNPGTVTLNGFSSTGSATWTGGAGSYSSTTAMNATYTSTVAERSGTVTLTLTSGSNGICNAVTDQVSFTFAPQITVNAGAAINVCNNNAVATLAGTSSTGSGTWTGGAGTFTASRNVLTPTYTLTAGEIATGSVTLTLTATGTGTCTAPNSTVTISVTPKPTVSISPVTICSGNTGSLTATLTGATGVSWSGGAGTFSPNNTSTTITYTPTAGERSTGSVTLTATTTTGLGNCNAVSSTGTITITPVPTVNAGADLVLCGNSATASLLATFTNATGVTWTTTGTGTLSSTTAANPTYTPSAADKTGVVTFTATTTGSAPCSAVSDQMTLSFTVVPTINAGPDQIVCSNAFPVQLNASGSPATWSGGAGAFSPSNTAMAGTYTPTAGEIGTNVTLTATTIAFGSCPAVSDQVVIQIVASPLANAGADATVCGNAANLTLNGSVTNATGLNWFTSATGTFSNPILGNSTYAPSAADKTAGTVTLKLVTTGNGSCPADTDDVVITITPIVTVNAGPDQTLCKDGTLATLSGAVTGATGGLWTVTSGTGVLTNPTTVAGATYTPSVADNSFTLRLTTTGNPTGCSALFDDVTITLSTPPTANAGADQNLCTTVASVALTGSVLNALSGVWTTNGSGTFSPNNTTLSTSYVPSAAEVSSTTAVNLNFTLTTVGNGVCAGTYTDVVNIVLAPKPTANANVDQTKCANNATVTLTGAVTNATGGTWTTSGDGAFGTATSLSTTYTPGANDKTNGSVNLTLTTTGVAPCTAVFDVMVVNITPAPTINAGPDRSVCANNAALSVISNVTVATGATWTTSGDGAFSGISANGLTATYTPGANDKTAGTVTLTSTSTGNGLCTSVNDALIVTITPAPTVNAGLDVTICADSFFVKLDANFTVATAGIWSTTGTGNFFNSNATYDTAIYVPSPADRANLGAAGGKVTLTFTTTIQGACLPVSDQLLITILPAPTVNAGTDKLICSNAANVSLTGTALNQGTTTWTTSGNGTFGSTAALNTTYTPSAVDKAAGNIVLTLTATGANPGCRTVFDQLFINITPLPVVNAGANQTVCADRIDSSPTGGILLAPTVSNQTGVSWATTGTGVFSPNNTTQAARYYPTAFDTTAHSVTLTLTATGNAPCPTVSATQVLTFRPIPIVNAGVDQTVCNGSNASIVGKVINATSGTWARSTGGTSGISNPAALSTTFVPTPADTTAGSVKLVLTSSGMGTCLAVTDTMVITFKKRPLINAGSDFSVCANAGNFQVTAIPTNATGVSWTASGTGGFSSTTGSPVFYSMTAADITNGTVTLTAKTTGMAPCAAVTDNVVVTITPVPTVDAGPNQTACSLDPNISLGGTVTNATGGFWATTGDGTFNNSNLLNAVYSYGPNDISALSVKLRLFTTGSGACTSVNDSIIITLTPTTNVNPMVNQTVCTTDFPIHLNGSGTAAMWSTSGDGSFSNVAALTGTYTPGATDITNGTVTLTLTPTGTCGGPPQNVTYTIIAGPTLSVTPIGDTCTNATTVFLKATTSAGAGNWTSTGSGSFTSTVALSTTYTPSAADKTSGNVLFTFTVPAAGFCAARKDTTTLVITPTPVVNAGPDKTLCANLLSAITLDGSHSLTGTLLWSKLDNMGVGTLTNTNQNTGNYQAVASDQGASPVRFELSIDNGKCSIQRDTMTLTVTPAPTVSVGNDTTICADKIALPIATYTVASGGVWTSTGTGTFTPNNSIDNPTYVPSAADTAAHTTVDLTFTTTGNGICTAVFDSKRITMTIKPVVIAGIDDSICSGQVSTTVSGVVLHAPGILWTTTGTGTFMSTTSANTTYFPSAQDKANGGAILRIASTGVTECDSSFDYKTIIIVPSPVAAVNAGFDQVICRDDAIAPMAGFIFVATGAKWDCNGAPCSGNFTPNDEDLFAQYIPSAADTAAGTVTLRLTTTTGNGICTPAFDDMLLTITDIPHPNAGVDKSVCADTTQVPLGGNIIAEALLMPVAYEWVSSGTGVFTPNAFVQNPVYVPSAADKASGSVIISLNSLNNGTCEKPTDMMTLNITPQPTINAGTDRTTCANVNGITTIGTMTVANSAIWTTSGSGSFSGTSANGLTATYDPSANDDAAGIVFLTLTTNGGLGNCKAVNDQYVLTIDPSPIVNAGPDQTICADNGAVPLNGAVTNATGGFWRTLGSGVFTPNTAALNGTYDPSNTDTTARVVRLVLTSSGNGFCLAEDDTITYTIDPIPVVNPGTATICRITTGALLSSSVSNALGGIWSTSGSGVFAANSAVINATYFPSLADSVAGLVTLTLTSTGNGVCNAVSKTTNLTITPVPVVVGAPDQFVCSGVPIVLTASTTSPNTSFEWKNSAGIIGATASISVNPTMDTLFFVRTVRPGGCGSAVDTVNVRVFAMPTSISLNGTQCLTDSNVINSVPNPAWPPAPGVYTWTRNGSLMGGQNGVNIFPNSTGTYAITFTAGACSLTSGSFTLNPSPIYSGIDKTNCVNNLTILSASTPLAVSGTAFTYVWDANPNIVSGVNGQQVTVQYATVFDTTSFNVTVTNEFNCSKEDSVYLITVAQPLLTLQNDTACVNDVIILSAVPTNFGVGTIPPIEDYLPTYVWTKNGTNLNVNNDTLLVTSDGEYIVNVIIGDCNNNTDTSTALFNTAPTLSLPANSRFCDVTDSTVTLNAGVTPEANKSYLYLWSTGETTASIVTTVPGMHYVTVTSILGSDSCQFIDSAFVKVVCSPRVHIPNVFIPGSDGPNGFFQIFGTHFDNFKLQVFSRWGEVVFSATDRTEMWDGSYKGEPMPAGVYPYILIYEGETEETKGPYKIEGEILIMR